MKDMKLQGMGPEAERTPLMFGSSGEFELDHVAEEFDAAGDHITEATVFFRFEDTLRAIAVAVTNGEDTPELDDPPVVELPFIDPESIIDILTLPSGQLIEISRPVRE